MRNQPEPLLTRGRSNHGNRISNGSVAQRPPCPDNGRAERRRIIRLTAVFLWLWPALLVLPVKAHCVEITPFYTQNQSPVAQIFGLPAAGDAKVLPKGKFSALLAADVASNFAQDKTSREDILLDGENYRFTLALRYGITDRIEGGIDIPYVGQGGGFLDNFIIGWHNFFGLPQGGRKEAPRNRLLYTYTKDGRNRLLINDSDFDIGDIRLYGGMQLYNDGRKNPRSVALRASIKVPTGDSRELHGSGSTDFALWLTASDDYQLPAWLGHFTFFGAAGGMGMTRGDVLADQQRNVAGFGTLGFGWGPAQWIALKAQVSGHTPFYQSDLRELGKDALQLIVGGTLAFSPQTSLDIGVSEDIIVRTSPDVAFHLALKRLF
jgi:hypothetical protein